MTYRKIAWVAFCTFLLVPFQNCSARKNFTSNKASTAQAAGNGGSYDGKPDVYRFYDLNNRCASADQNGRALPNDVIVVKANSSGVKTAHLSRLACAEITPTPIADGEITWSSNSEFTYQNKSFTGQAAPGEFDIVLPHCPAGQTYRAGAVLNNQVGSGLVLNVAPWEIYQGVSSSLYGTIHSVPSYRIARPTSTFLEYWQRINQVHNLTSNTSFVYSFLAEAGSKQGVDWTFFRNVSGSPPNTSSPLDDSALIHFNLATGTANIVFSQNITNVSMRMTRVGNGYLCSVFFTTTATVNPPQTLIGLGPTAQQGAPAVGDSVQAANVMLLPVNQLCQ